MQVGDAAWLGSHLPPSGPEWRYQGAHQAGDQAPSLHHPSLAEQKVWVGKYSAHALGILLGIQMLLVCGGGALGMDIFKKLSKDFSLQPGLGTTGESG